MTLCRVTGSVTTTIKHESLRGKTLLVCQPIDPATGADRGKTMVAVDTVQAGVGDTVLVLDEGTAARKILGEPAAPIRTVITAIVDTVIVDGA
ncbi:MAG: hypothetical protein E4H09_04455 [Spirochaetales bacterium]|nr:MAG: hypothetical protein E4H09_04455 [Spirochaetales bacterium]